jgi:ribosomal protein S21
MSRYNKRKKSKRDENEIGPLEVEVYDPSSKESLDRAIKKLNRMVRKEGVIQEVMWRRHKREKREKKPKYFK